MGFGSRCAEACVESTAEAAFASDERGRIVACNGAAERLLGIARGGAVGRDCHEVVSGLDAFGRRFCGPACEPLEAVRRREPLQAFPLELKRASRELVRVDVSCVAVRGEGSSSPVLVHLLRSSASAGSACLEEMRVGARRCHGASPGEAVSRVEGAEGAGEDPPLTARETQILRLLAGGLNPRGIAAELRLSLATVRTHIRNVLRKLGVHGATQAVTCALRRGLV